MAITEDQSDVVEFLGATSTHGGAAVERIETHISIVFLSGSLAWKLKRAVRLDYIDASTSDIRRWLCDKEVELNRRTAPTLYLGVVAVTREADGSLALGGKGTPVDWVVKMNRFEQHALFDRLAQRGALDVALMERLATAVASFHRGAAVRRDHGGTAGMRWVVDGNAEGLAEFGSGLFATEAIERVIADTRVALGACSSLLDDRREAGLVRQCHGDLHLRNIVMYDGHPVLFDGVEFNDEIACVDVLYDVAFLLMDLWRRGLAPHANAVWNRYLGETGDLAGVGVMPLFLSCRAAIRAKTGAMSMRMQSDEARARELGSAACEYLEMAGRLLHPPAPLVVAIGGLSGSGKSTAARAIASHLGAVPGAIVLRSDEIRKEIRGVPMLTRLDPEAYTAGVTDSVYATLAERAGTVVRGGFTAVVDATWLRPADRHAIEAVARDAAVPFVGLWLDARVPVLLERLETRDGDVSDADAAVLATQRTQDVGPMTWHRLDSSASVERVCDRILSLLGEQVNDAS